MTTGQVVLLGALTVLAEAFLVGLAGISFWTAAVTDPGHGPASGSVSGVVGDQGAPCRPQRAAHFPLKAEQPVGAANTDRPDQTGC